MPLSLWERVRVRAVDNRIHLIHLIIHLPSLTPSPPAPLPKGEGRDRIITMVRRSFSTSHSLKFPRTRTSGWAGWAIGHLLFSGCWACSDLPPAFALGWARHDGWRYFFHSYLLNYCFVLSIALGGLFFINMQHITRAGWSVVLHRLAECLGANIPCLMALFLPILIPVLQGNGVLYPWADPAAASGSELLRHKAAYLEPTFFGFRAVGYFAVWLLLTRYFLTHSLAQDRTGDTAETLRMERFSPAAMLLFAGTVTFAAIDWLMSLTPDWYSTIFGVYFFAGIAVAGLSALILTSICLQAPADWFA